LLLARHPGAHHEINDKPKLKLQMTEQFIVQRA
jgi:hypothetical protein